MMSDASDNSDNHNNVDSTPSFQEANEFDFISSGKRTVAIESKAIDTLTQRINHHFAAACSIMRKCQGRIIVMGIGKSGHIARKIAATLASTGSPAFFVHPAEANHGDLGMITPKDVVVAISNSGGSNEILTLLPLLKRLDIPLIAMTGKPSSPLAQASEVHLDISVETEACPLNLAPTSSTTATLVMGDALAIALLESNGFNAEDFAFSHPGGALGRKLLVKVANLMHIGDAMPKVTLGSTLADTLKEMSAKGLGMTIVVDHSDKLAGIFTDGDLRRHINSGQSLKGVTIDALINHHPKTISSHVLAAQALHQMETLKITSLVVESDELDTNDTKRPLGVIHLHDILKAGVV